MKIKELENRLLSDENLTFNEYIRLYVFSLSPYIRETAKRMLI